MRPPTYALNKLEKTCKNCENPAALYISDDFVYCTRCRELEDDCKCATEAAGGVITQLKPYNLQVVYPTISSATTTLSPLDIKW